MKKGFTLIELLAVIVILAIIALIATPIVLNIINDTKESSKERSKELYVDAVEQAIMRENLTEPFNPTECSIQSDGNLLCNGKLLKVETDGTRPTSGTIKLNNGKITQTEILFEGDTPSKLCMAVDSSKKGSIALGTEYKCTVKSDGTKYNFYVLSVDKDASGNISQVNLILNSNLDSNGVPTATQDMEVNWGSTDAEIKKYGPIVAMEKLNQLTSNWDKLPNINIFYSYGDEFQDESYKISTEDDKTSIYKEVREYTGPESYKDIRYEYASYSNLKARLPKLIELTNAGCSTSQKSCQSFLLNNLNETGLNSYWTLTHGSIFADANNGTSSVIGTMLLDGVIDSNYYYPSGIRPVINVQLTDLG